MPEQPKPPEFKRSHHEVMMLAAFALETYWPQFKIEPFTFAVDYAETVAEAAEDIASGSATSDEAATLLEQHERITLDDDLVPVFVAAVLDVAEKIRPDSAKAIYGKDAMTERTLHHESEVGDTATHYSRSHAKGVKSVIIYAVMGRILIDHLLQSVEFGTLFSARPDDIVSKDWAVEAATILCDGMMVLELHLAAGSSLEEVHGPLPILIDEVKHVEAQLEALPSVEAARPGKWRFTKIDADDRWKEP
jgi:hypothetical protein